MSWFTIHARPPVFCAGSAGGKEKESAVLINLPAVFIANGLGAVLMLTLIISNRRGNRTEYLEEKQIFAKC